MRFRRRQRYKMPMLNTASLPDLIFTVLFFFMMVTHMRNAPLRVNYKMPQGRELTRIDKQSPVIYMYIGVPSASSHNHGGKEQAVVQVGEKYLSPQEITDYVAAKRALLLPQDKSRLVVSIRADRNVRMSMINEVRQALRQANVSRILMAAEAIPSSATGHARKGSQRVSLPVRTSME